MNAGKRTDILLNVLLPLLAGSLVYLLPGIFSNLSFTRNHLADGLWAYAFLSALLIVWNRMLVRQWIAVAFTVAIAFEWLQYEDFIGGSGDWKDILVYCLFFIVVILFNSFFRKRLNALT